MSSKLFNEKPSLVGKNRKVPNKQAILMKMVLPRWPSMIIKISKFIKQSSETDKKDSNVVVQAFKSDKINLKVVKQATKSDKKI